MSELRKTRGFDVDDAVLILQSAFDKQEFAAGND